MILGSPFITVFLQHGIYLLVPGFIFPYFRHSYQGQSICSAIYRLTLFWISDITSSTLFCPAK